MGFYERRFALRSRTQQAHERLDAAVGAFSTLSDYRRYVARLASFRLAMDAALEAVAWPEHWQWRPPRVAGALAADAADLDLPPILAMPAAEASVDLSDPSRLLGALYVLEGSTLGARVLKKRAAVLGLDEGFGARHLTLMSKDIAQWQSFLVVLEGAEDFDIALASLSANTVFALALRCFESELLVVH
jgi:heme oxygenase